MHPSQNVIRSSTFGALHISQFRDSWKTVIQNSIGCYNRWWNVRNWLQIYRKKHVLLLVFHSYFCKFLQICAAPNWRLTTCSLRDVPGLGDRLSGLNDGLICEMMSWCWCCSPEPAAGCWCCWCACCCWCCCWCCWCCCWCCCGFCCWRWLRALRSRVTLMLAVPDRCTTLSSMCTIRGCTPIYTLLVVDCII